ncbi:MAG: hypothetical protein H7647_04350 [Candidatus Heimdallarchaeota archaeon]|jgi:hypothetical protein|nr:hypothetical protein [Candidatus Heimdallarchaeota archaeon]MCK4253657.1 hypothetical protein [Candidatus Heimdallarchaeota archaeon]
MNVYQVIRKRLKQVKEPYKFLNGDVYLVVTPTHIWIWLGSKSYCDDKAVGAWTAKVIEEDNKSLEIDTVMDGDEPQEFKDLITFEVLEGDTPGFLKHFDKKVDIDYKLLKIQQDSDGLIKTSEVPIKKKSFKSGDSFVLDAWDELYVWIGKKSQVKEKYEAGRISRALDVERKRTPVIYTMDEGQEPKGFWDIVERIQKEDPKK